MLMQSIDCPICADKKPPRNELIEIVELISRVRCCWCGLIFFCGKPNNLPVYDLRYNRHFFRPSDIRKAGIMSATLAEFANKEFKDPRILEVGPGNGLTAYLLKRMNYDIEALEIEADQGNFIIHTYGIYTYLGCFEYTPIKKQFNLIYAGHVLEHSWEPLRFLESARVALLPKGIVYLAMPDNHYAKKSGRHWHHFKTRNPFEHCSLFGEQTLDIAAKKTGFVVEEVITNPDYQSFQAILRRK